MASQTVTLELTVSQAKAVSDLLAVNDAIKKMSGSLNQTFDKASQKGSKVSGGFTAIHSSIDRAVKAFLSLNMGMRAFSQAISLIRAELEKTKEYRMAAADKGSEVHRIMGRIKKFIPGAESGLNDLGSMPAETILQKALQYSTKTGIPLTNVLTAVETAMSGGVTQKATERVQTGFELAPALAEWGADELAVAGQAVQMARESFGIDAKSAIASFVQAQGTSQIVSAGKVAQNLIAGATQMSQMGYGWEDALEFMVGVQAATKDPHGRMSRTIGLANVAMTYEKFGDQFGLKGKDIEDFMRAQGRFGPGTEHHDMAMQWNRRLMGGALDKALMTKAEDMLRGSGMSLADLEGELSDLRGRSTLKPGFKDFIAHEPTEATAKLLASVESTITDTGTAVKEFGEKNKITLATFGYRLGLMTEAQTEAQLMADPAAIVMGNLHKYLSGPATTRLGMVGGVLKDPWAQFQATVARTRNDLPAAFNAYIESLQQQDEAVRRVEEKKRPSLWLRAAGGMGGTGASAGIPHVRTRLRTDEEMLREDPAGYNVSTGIRNMIEVLEGMRDDLKEQQAQWVAVQLQRLSEEPPVPTNQAAVPDVVPQAD